MGYIGIQKMDLNGEWQLTAIPPEESGEEAFRIPAAVPGTAQAALQQAGVLPADLYDGTNILRLRKYEFFSWVYERTFVLDTLPGAHEEAVLTFDGLDCRGCVYLNNRLVRTSANALVPIVCADVGTCLQAGENTLRVEIASPLAAEQADRKRLLDMSPLEDGLSGGMEGLHIRRAPSSYGWDILCRAVTSGLWRGVRLEYLPRTRVMEAFITTEGLDEHSARMRIFYSYTTDIPYYKGLTWRLEVLDGDAPIFTHEEPVWYTVEKYVFTVPDPKLWWPAGYGGQHLYTYRITLLQDGQVCSVYEDKMGVRLLKFARTELNLPDKPGDFSFYVNYTRILCKGSNWVPLDALRMEDADRYEKALALFKDTYCNMLRCWGGNVYEDDRFYALCDEYGILVWQDFTMACGRYPQDEAFQAQIRDEAADIVRKLRQHPCIALWSGDNECDHAWNGVGVDPNTNLLTRQILPEAVRRYDYRRPFLPSSPYLGPETFARKRFDCVSEDHLWGPRDYFKSGFYLSKPCLFVSEQGYHGCPNRESLEKFLTPKKLWPWWEEPIAGRKIAKDEWRLHGADFTMRPDGPYAHRTKLMSDQVAQFFGREAEDLDEFILLSQAVQAEAFKFFIEYCRSQKWRKTGILWWNMLDGWPQTSDAVVDWYFSKKLAYHFIKQSQQPLCLMFREPRDWRIDLVAANDTLRDFSGSYAVTDYASGETLLSGSFKSPANESLVIDSLRVESAAHRLYLITWELDGATYRNHYLCGRPPFDTGLAQVLHGLYPAG
ncbi:MAG: hypothetical protein LBR73_04780 [Oscillospiraceae bacterium]|jgi:beta-mannosidase|nr:hypothetical protein [Oscillospiraceae bacterium]